MSKISLVIRREFFTRIRKRSFIIMTLLGPLLIAGFIVLAIWVGMQEREDQKVLVQDEHHLVKGKLEAKDFISFDYTDEEWSDQEFKNSDYSLYLVIHEKPMQVNALELYYKRAPSFFTQNYIENEVESIFERYKLKATGVDPNDYARIKTRVNIKTIDIETGEENKYRKERALVGFFFAALIYFFIFMYGVQVMRGVIEEKTNRIVEVIVSSVRPFQLMLGKIIGVALVGLTQFILWVIITGFLTVGAQTAFFPERYDPTQILQKQEVAENIEEEVAEKKVSATDAKNYALDLLKRINFPLMIGMFIFFFLGGYLLYSSLFAAVGSAVDSESDTQQFMLPLTIPLIFGFVMAEFAVADPQGPAATWFSIIPLTSPIVMVVRVSMGFDAGTLWQLFLSMGLLILGFLFTTWLAGRIYRVGILIYGKKASLGDLWKWIRHD
ncbi:MAG: ABC transporter permease [Flavobacteriales bacterium]